jgi:hypothetical protein
VIHLYKTEAAMKAMLATVRSLLNVEISRFCRGVIDVFAAPGRYAA